MELLRAIIGVIFLTIAVTIWVWIIRNFFRPRYNQALAYKKNVVIPLIVISIIFAPLGIYIHPKNDFILGLIFGFILGLKVSK